MAQDPTQRPSISKIEQDLYLGDSISSRRRQILEENNITAVVSLGSGRWVHWSQPWYKTIIPEGRHFYFPCNDSMTQDVLPKIAEICDFIDNCREKKVTDLSSVLVHCDRGVSRSATVMIAYLMRTHRWSFDTALGFVADKRQIKPNGNFKEQLQVWEAVRYDIWEDAREKVPRKEYAEYLGRRAQRLKDAGLTGDEPIGIQSL